MSDCRYVCVGALALLILGACSRDRDDIPQRPKYAASRVTPGQAPSLDSITHLSITLPESRMPRTFPRDPWVITEPRTVSALVDFVTRRDSSWQRAESPAAQLSEPLMFADYYRGPELVATVALRMDQVGIQGQQGSLVQPLSSSDAAAFLVLVGAPIKIVPVPPRDTVGKTP